MTLNLTPESYPIHKRVVVGTFDTSAAGCRLVLLHPKASTDAASARVTVTGLDLGLSPAFGSDWGAIHVFNEKEVQAHFGLSSNFTSLLLIISRLPLLRSTLATLTLPLHLIWPLRCLSS
eukprot:TRINITY_DN189_c0_g1_i2.p1 TRINITY_DN189_c0_g1~~TRINITY_DN189_c0_g1_i2.p1  ORF type:complete len:130 (+),score=8.53 TRINITY_DN189_c0_g1_i2:33-392(+)